MTEDINRNSLLFYKQRNNIYQTKNKKKNFITL